MFRQYRYRRVMLFAVVIAASSAIGCFGGAWNPGYFPHYIPGGDIIRTHAKPPGRGYFRDFDPKAFCLTVTPKQCNLAPKAQQVIVATVVDQDDQARRGRRVEWILDGPGYIVEVDESGWVGGRGYKVDNKYAVSFTDYFEHNVTRGNEDPRDDFSIQPGQTWCVVSCAVPGETTVTAYAPEVFNWEKGRAYAKLSWASGDDLSFPAPSVARFGGDALLSTRVNSLIAESGANAADVKVRYRVVGGPPAVLVGSNASVSEARAGRSDLEILADPDGKADVRIIQPRESARPGKTQVAIEVVKPDPSGTGPGTVIGRKTTVVEWAAPSLSLDVKAARSAAVEQPTSFTYVLANTGPVESSSVIVRATLPAGAAVESIDPPPVLRNETQVEWRSDALRAGSNQEFRVVVKPKRAGSLATRVTAETTDGLRAEATASTDVGNPTIKLNVESQVVAAVGDRVQVKMAVRNPSNVAIANAVAHVGLLTQGLEHDTGNRTVEVTVGSIPAGQVKTLDVPLIARETGRHRVLLSVTADGNLNDSAESTVEVRQAAFIVAVGGPEQLAPGQEATYQVRVENSGEVALPDVQVKVTLPSMLSARNADAGGRVATAEAATWSLGTLAPAERKNLKLTVVADRVGERAAITAFATSPAAGNKNRTAKAETFASVIGMPALTLELVEPSGAVPVGRRAGYRVVVRNRGTGTARNVDVRITLPDEYANARGTGANREDVRPEGNVLPFPVLKEVPAGATVVFAFEVEGAKVGDARVKAEARADYLPQPLREEQATRVIDKR